MVGGISTRLLLSVLPPCLWLLDWMATYAVHSTLLILAVWTLTSSALGRRLRIAQSVELWRMAMVGGVVTSLSAVATVFQPFASTISLLPVQTSDVGLRVMMAAHAATPWSPPVLTTQVEVRPLWPLVVTPLWLAGAIVCVTLLLLARRRLSQCADRSDRLEQGAVAGALAHVKRRAAVRRDISVRVSDVLSTPVAHGRSEILLPRRGLAEFDLAQLESILAHELAHLERRDGWWPLVARAVEAVFFFQPLNRLARRRMMEASEFAADAWAVSVTARPVTLARCLARVAEWSVSEPAWLAPAMAERRPSALVRRVRRLTSGAREPSPRRVAPAALALLIALALFAPRAAIPGHRAAGPRRAERMMLIVQQETGNR